MGRYLVEFGGKYLEWSSVSDAPVTCLMDGDELKRYIQQEYGRVGLCELPGRMERIERYGISALDGTTKYDLLANNRAGPDESHLATEAEIVARYARQRLG